MNDPKGVAPATGISLHLVPEEVWLAHENLNEYRPEGFAAEGFAHLTDDAEVLLEVANRFYRDDSRPFILLEVDLDQVRAAAIYEDEECRFPHVYGPIERHAIRAVRRVVRAPDGTFVALGAEEPA